MTRTESDQLTIAGIGLLAMCTVTFDHEALGHGGMCLLLHGQIELLTSSLFRCDLESGWISAAGPLCSLALGTLTLIGARLVSRRSSGVRLFLISVTAFSYFWEAGYMLRAMFERDGDLYFAAQALGSEPTLWFRIAAAAGGLALFVFAARLTRSALLTTWSEPGAARGVGRTIWISATLGAGVAALAYRGEGMRDLQDAVLEFAAAFPLLLIPGVGRAPAGATASDGSPGSKAALPRRPLTIALALCCFAVFVVTLGRGIVLGARG